MAKRPKLRMTNADYVAIAVSPALIMALVGSLVFFLIEVLYVGQYQLRLNYVFALFVFAIVLIARISMETGAERAVVFAVPLGIAMFLVLEKFVQHTSPLSRAINLGLLGIVWWSAHKLTWDSTLIDDSEDASGEGLMQRLETDQQRLGEQNKLPSPENQQQSASPSKEYKTPHPPGLWVLYFSLAALPLFGIGQKWIPASDVGRRQYVFALLTVYLAAGLALLVTTSFLSLRRYLRQRQVEMPTSMATTWVATGGILIVIVMLLATLLPRPQAEYAFSQVPWQTASPTNLVASRESIGNDGTEIGTSNSPRVQSSATGPQAITTEESDSSTSSDQASPESQVAEKESNPDNKTPSSKPHARAQRQPSPARSSPTEQTDGNAGRENSAPPQTPRDKSPPSAQAEPGSATESPPAPSSFPSLLSETGILAAVLKTGFYVVVLLTLGVLTWRNRRQILQTLHEIYQQFRDLWARLCGIHLFPSADTVDHKTEKSSVLPPRPFASYTDPFASDQYRKLPPAEVVRYTFEAFEAWAREQGFPRSPNQTPLELVRLVLPQQSPLRTAALQLVHLYNEAAYAPQTVSNSKVAKLAQLWAHLRQRPPGPPSAEAGRTPISAGPNRLTFSAVPGGHSKVIKFDTVSF